MKQHDGGVTPQQQPTTSTNLAFISYGITLLKQQKKKKKSKETNNKFKKP